MEDAARANEVMRKFGQVVARAWVDDAFKHRLLAEPNSVLKEQGLDLPPGVDFKIVENTDKVIYLPLPPTPTDTLSDDQLEQIAGGSTASTAGTTGSLATICGTASSASTAGTFGSM